MPSLYCLRCESPVFRIISDAVVEYCCLRLECANFKLSVRESATGISLGSDSEEVVKTEPHCRQGLDSYTHHGAVAGQSSQPSERQGSRAVRHRATTPTPEVNRVEASTGRSDHVAERGGRECIRVLQKPLSEHAIDGSDPIAETRAWINRPVEQRRAEVPTNQKAKKPLNAYILYRKAYADTAKKVTRSANQLPWLAVPILADSWSMETDSVRAQFRVLATTEKMVHKLAFPDYKLTTRKSAQD